MSALGGSTPPPQINQPAPAESDSLPAQQSSILAKEKKKLTLNKEGAGHQELDKDGTPGRTMSPTLLPSPPLTMSPSDRRPSPRGSPLMRPAGASPNRRIRSTSPGLHSPASSLIFERNVQEPEPSADVPAHIKTEDFIPPALDASSLAITDNHLDPDDVEIVMHSAHQPAAVVVAGGMSDSLYSPSLVHEDTTASAHADLTEPASDYGSLDMTDPKRLSFISFADVVQAEHVEQDRQEMLGAGSGEGLMSLSSMANASPSPILSPHGLGASPPVSGTASPKAADIDMTRSPGSPSFPLGADLHSMPAEPPLQIETMRQALRKTHSGELGGFRSPPLSNPSLEDATVPK